MAKVKKLWEQQDGEPDGAYRRFCLYRDMGPKRTLVSAYGEWHLSRPQKFTAEGGIEEGPKKPSVSGGWKKIAREFRWAERVRAWDIERFSTDGQDAVFATFRYLRTFAIQGQAMLEDAKLLPTDWELHLKTVSELVQLIPRETLDALLRTRDAGPAQPGQSGDGVVGRVG